MQKHMERFLEAQVYISIKFIIIAFRFKNEIFYISIFFVSAARWQMTLIVVLLRDNPD